MEKFEQFKFLTYLHNVLKNKRFFKEHLADIFDWHDSQGKDIIAYPWTTQAEIDQCLDFKDIIRMQKKEAFLRGEKFIEKINKKIISLSKSPTSGFEKRLCQVAKLLALTETEQKIYGLLIFFCIFIDYT